MIYKVVWDNDTCCDSFETPSIGQGKEDCYELYINWRSETCGDWWGSRMPTEKEIEDHDYLIFNCEAFVAEFPDDYDDTEDRECDYYDEREYNPSDHRVWEMDEETQKNLLWDEWENIKDNYAEAINGMKGE